MNAQFYSENMNRTDHFENLGTQDNIKTDHKETTCDGMSCV